MHRTIIRPNALHYKTRLPLYLNLRYNASEFDPQTQGGDR